MAARSGTYLLVSCVLTAVYLGGLYLTIGSANRGPFMRVMKWVMLGLVTPILVIGVPTYIAKKVLEHRRQAQSLEAPAASEPGAPKAGSQK
jgi:hypothetical protein